MVEGEPQQPSATADGWQTQQPHISTRSNRIMSIKPNQNNKPFDCQTELQKIWSEKLAPNPNNKVIHADKPFFDYEASLVQIWQDKLRSKISEVLCA
jgi:hypothetical protein